MDAAGGGGGSSADINRMHFCRVVEDTDELRRTFRECGGTACVDGKLPPACRPPRAQSYILYSPATTTTTTTTTATTPIPDALEAGFGHFSKKVPPAPWLLLLGGHTLSNTAPRSAAGQGTRAPAAPSRVATTAASRSMSSCPSRPRHLLGLNHHLEPRRSRGAPTHSNKLAGKRASATKNRTPVHATRPLQSTSDAGRGGAQSTPSRTALPHLGAPGSCTKWRPFFLKPARHKRADQVHPRKKRHGRSL